MFKYRYLVQYTVRPNKRATGNFCAMNCTFSAPLEKVETQAKLMKFLCKVHRVNPNAIELDKYTLIQRDFVPWKVVRDAFVAFFGRLREVHAEDKGGAQ